MKFGKRKLHCTRRKTQCIIRLLVAVAKVYGVLLMTTSQHAQSISTLKFQEEVIQTYRITKARQVESGHLSWLAKQLSLSRREKDSMKIRNK